MKTLYEGILDDMEDTLAHGEDDALLSMLFSKNLEHRRKAFDVLLSMVESYRPKRHKTTAKMKNSDSYFVEFVYPFGVQNGEATEILDYITYIQICKRTGLSYRTACINASEDRWGDKINVFELNWNYTQPNFNPKASNVKLYEVPEELNQLFKRIQKEAYNHR
jgi:hypothetical protein